MIGTHYQWEWVERTDDTRFKERLDVWLKDRWHRDTQCGAKSNVQLKGLKRNISNCFLFWSLESGVCLPVCKILEAIRHSFSKVTPRAFQALFASHVESWLEYGAAAAYPCTGTKSNQLKKVQNAATRMVRGRSKTNHRHRLHALRLFPQSYRRIRDDSITLWSIIRENMSPQLLLSVK